jgi:hypothetical protein
MKFDERNQFFFKSPLFRFHGNCGKVCPTDSDFFGLFMWMLFLSSFINFCLARCHGNGQNAKKNEKHKNDHSRLLAKQKLMKLDRNNIHMNKPKKSESVGQTLPQPFWKNQPLKAQLHMAYDNPTKFHYGISEKCVGQTFDGRKKEKEE